VGQKQHVGLGQLIRQTTRRRGCHFSGHAPCPYDQPGRASVGIL
jgi:hypothetical protein